MLDNRRLAEDLCAVSPALRECLRAHLARFGTLIPHVFMGDVLARVGACLPPGEPAAVVEASAILAALERGLATGDQETRNVIAVSFVGDCELESFFRRLEPYMGPKVRGQLQGK